MLQIEKIIKSASFLALFLASSCVFHTGNVSSGSDIDCPIVYTAKGTSSTYKILGMGGFNNESLIIEAKKDLYQRFPYKKGIKLSNFSVDYRNTYFLIVAKTTLIVSADVFDCNNSNTNDEVTRFDGIDIANIKGFKLGDSIIYDEERVLGGIVFKHLINNKMMVSFDGSKAKKVKYNQVYKATRSADNVSFFGFDTGDTAKVKVDNVKTGLSAMKKCVVLAINHDKAYVEYIKDDGQKRKVFVNKLVLKK